MGVKGKDDKAECEAERRKEENNKLKINTNESRTVVNGQPAKQSMFILAHFPLMNTKQQFQFMNRLGKSKNKNCFKTIKVKMTFEFSLPVIYENKTI